MKVKRKHTEVEKMLPITYLTGDLYLEYIYKELLKLNNEEKIAK